MKNSQNNKAGGSEEEEGVEDGEEEMESIVDEYMSMAQIDSSKPNCIVDVSTSKHKDYCKPKGQLELKMMMRKNIDDILTEDKILGFKNPRMFTVGDVRQITVSNLDSKSASP